MSLDEVIHQSVPAMLLGLAGAAAGLWRRVSTNEKSIALVAASVDGLKEQLANLQSSLEKSADRNSQKLDRVHQRIDAVIEKLPK